MRVVFYSQGEDMQQWQAALARHMPDIRLEAWEAAPAGADYAIAWKPPAVLFQQQPDLKAMFALGAGVDALIAHCPPTLPLIRLEDSGMATQMADYATRMILDWFYRDADYRQQQKQAKWLPYALDDKQQWPIGILGLGQLGSVVAQRCLSLGFPVHGWRNSPEAVPGMTTHWGGAGLQEMLPHCKVLINLLPLTPQTSNLINRDVLDRLPKGAFLINMARGAQVVDEDLLAALDRGQLAGAALDVFRQEPLPATHPFWSHPAIRVTPHVAGITPLHDAAEQIANKLQAFDAGKPVSGLVDRERGY